jgi:hypothetical protein
MGVRRSWWAARMLLLRNLLSKCLALHSAWSGSIAENLA